MKPHSSEAHNNSVSMPKLILAIILTTIATISVLEWQGLLKHSQHKDDFALSSYQAILIDQQQEDYRLSRKPSGQHARCQQGFLFIQSDLNENMQGLLVDYKNRGVKCTPASVEGSKIAPISSAPSHD